MGKKKIVRVKSKGAAKTPSFEEALHQLETIVSDLEGGNLSLDESLAKYEHGIRNLKTCHSILQKAENRIRLLTGVDRDGTPVTDEFDSTATGLDNRSTQRSANLDDAAHLDDAADLEEDDESGSLF